MKHFVKKWELLTKDQSILEIVKGYQIPFISQPLQQKLSWEIHLNLKEKSVVTVEIGNILKKVAMEKTHMKKVSAKSQFVSNLSVVKKKDGGGGNRRGHYRFEESEPLHSRSPQKQQIQA